MTDNGSDRIVVVGGGVAGLSAALALAPLPVTVLVASPLGTGAATAWAQGGIAAAVDPADSPAAHAEDTLRAAAGLGQPDIAALVTGAAPGAIDWLADLGTPFDREPDGRLALGLEAAHSARRITHAGGDATGLKVLETLIAATRRSPSIIVREGVRVTGLVSDETGRVRGVLARCGDDGVAEAVPARAVVLATGGLGGLYGGTTNPPGAIGRGLALAGRAGAVLRDMEFVQFHPTAIVCGADPMPLATEALRGEGAILVNGHGERFMETVPGRELAPRDVVARAIFAEIARGEPVFLDARPALGARFPVRFPAVAALCASAGLDPVRQAIPVRPAAHYHMGGLRVDTEGRTSLAGLFACGEVASTGLHGANRLASNSLLEAVVFARRIAGTLRGETAPAAAPLRPAPAQAPEMSAADFATLRTLMDADVGVVRSAASLSRALARLGRLAAAHAVAPDAVAVAAAIAAGALKRQESRGGHARADYTATAPQARHSETDLATALAEAAGHAAAVADRTASEQRRVA